MKSKTSIIGIIMGSDSDLPIMKDAASVLDEFGINYEIKVLSAHRSPLLTHAYATGAAKRGIKVVVAAAGGAAHLAGIFASLFPGPVIGVPIKTATLNGVDSLYSTVQMPPGVPVATVGINAAQNAALLAVQILATGDNSLVKKLIIYKQKMVAKIEEKNKKLRRLGVSKYLKQIT